MADHGKHSTYAKGCRCSPCRHAHATYERIKARERYSAKTIPVGMWPYLLGELIDFWGHSAHELAEITGLSVQAILDIRKNRRRRMRISTNNSLMKLLYLFPANASDIPWDR